MSGDVHKVIIVCAACYMAKSNFHQSLYTHLPIPSSAWDDINMDITVALPRTPKGEDSIMMVVD